jgi:cysteine dioxygenase
MATVKIDQLVSGLREMSDEMFVCEPVYEYLSSRQLDADSIQKYLQWSPKFYTRNLIYKDERFEMMAICWDKGQVSRVHNHWDQRCWMMVPVGKLLGQNFGVEEIDESRGYCKLYETNNFELTECLAARVDLEEPIHQVLNLAEYDERAVSIHIYSKPYDRCLSYCRDTDTFKEVILSYTSIDGKLCDGVQL